MLGIFEVFLKPPKTGMKAPFHQDNYYWNLKDKRAINLWIALDKVDKSNGGLIYLKGSHNEGIIKHKMSKKLKVRHKKLIKTK